MCYGCYNPPYNVNTIKCSHIRTIRKSGKCEIADGLLPCQTETIYRHEVAINGDVVHFEILDTAGQVRMLFSSKLI